MKRDVQELEIGDFVVCHKKYNTYLPEGRVLCVISRNEFNIVLNGWVVGDVNIEPSSQFYEYFEFYDRKHAVGDYVRCNRDVHSNLYCTVGRVYEIVTVLRDSFDVIADNGKKSNFKIWNPKFTRCIKMVKKY